MYIDTHLSIHNSIPGGQRAQFRLKTTVTVLNVPQGSMLGPLILSLEKSLRCLGA